MNLLNVQQNEGQSLMKDLINGYVVSKTIKSLINTPILQKSKYYVLYLEGLSLRTTKVLLNAGIDRSKLIPVSNEAPLNNMQELAPNAVYGWTDNVFGPNGLAENHFATVWLDYCGSWLGNNTTKVYPPDDLKTVLKWYVIAGSRVYLTLSARGKRGTTLNGTIQDIINIIKNSKFPNSIIKEPTIYKHQTTMMFISITVK